MKTERETALTAHYRFLSPALCISVLLLLLLAVALISISVGSVPVPLSDIITVLLSSLGLSHGEVSATVRIIIMSIRLPRTALDILIGMGLAASGVAMQGVFRNPMASPYVTGIASAGAFGAALATIMGFSILAQGPTAFLCAVISAFLVYALGRTKSTVPIESLLLSGIAVSLFFTALVSLLQYISDARQLREIMLWSMGRLWEANRLKVIIALPVMGIGIAGLMFFSKELNIILLGDRNALDLGVNVRSVRRWIIILVSLITGVAVAVGGVIGFVGLIIPHAIRMIMGPDHKYLFPAAAIAGGIFLCAIDTLSRIIAAPTEIPAGILTALIGVPFFLMILSHRRKTMGFGHDA